MKAVGEFKTVMFRTYGTQSLVVKILVRHMNVTAKDIALINQTAYSGVILCRLPLGNGQKGDKENRPCKSHFQGINLLSDGIEFAIKILAT